jgi:hypothetical protein
MVYDYVAFGRLAADGAPGGGGTVTIDEIRQPRTEGLVGRC